MNDARPEQGRRLLDEALRLLDLAQATRPAAAGSAARTAGQDADGHAGPECNVCPICRGVRYLRQVDPQGAERLTAAVADVATAVRDLFGPIPAEPRASARGPAGDGGAAGDGVPRVRVQQIDVTD